MGITEGELGLDRADQALWLPETCTRSRPTTTTTATGSSKPGTPATATYVCRLSSRGVPREYLELGAQRGAQYWMVTLPYGADVRAKDQLAIGAQTLEVVGLASGGAWQSAVRAVCVEVS